MVVELSRDYRFEAAHSLPRLPSGHKCARVHGHNFLVTVTLAGAVNETSGLLVEFGEVNRAVEPVIDELDHRSLNEIEGLENPTSEILARWLWRRLEAALPALAAITVAETPGARCTYRGR